KNAESMIRCLDLLTIVTTCVGIVRAADQNGRAVIYDGVATQVSASPNSSNDLWITTNDLARATRFAIMPQGVCRDELCFPLPKTRIAEFVSKKDGTTWFNLTEFARLIKQSFVVDQKNRVWYFGARETEQNSYLDSLEATNFTLLDLGGKLHSFTDFPGNNHLIITCTSWCRRRF